MEAEGNTHNGVLIFLSGWTNSLFLLSTNRTIWLKAMTALLDTCQAHPMIFRSQTAACLRHMCRLRRDKKCNNSQVPLDVLLVFFFKK